MKTNALKRQFYQDLEESLDKNFPKGKCKERGSALVMFSDALRLLDKLNKAFGGCDNGTKTEFAESYEDFGGEETS